MNTNFLTLESNPFIFILNLKLNIESFLPFLEGYFLTEQFNLNYVLEIAKLNKKRLNNTI
jgi:hypothetical protein